jgi:hypothetical protein
MAMATEMTDERFGAIAARASVGLVVSQADPGCDIDKDDGRNLVASADDDLAAWIMQAYEDRRELVREVRRLRAALARLSAVPAADREAKLQAALLQAACGEVTGLCDGMSVSTGIYRCRWCGKTATAPDAIPHADCCVVGAALASPASGAAETAEGKTPGQEIAEQWAKRMIHRHGSTLGWLLDEEAELARDIDAALPSPPSPAPTGTAEAKAVAFWRVPDAAGWFFECADCGAVATEIDMFHKPGCPNVYVPDAPPTKKADAATPAQAYREGRAHGAEVAAVRAVVTAGAADRVADAITKEWDVGNLLQMPEGGFVEGDEIFAHASIESVSEVVARALKGQAVQTAGGVEGGWRKGPPPVTGYYWVNNRCTRRVLTAEGSADEEYPRPGSGSEPYSLARVYISPTGSPGKDLGRAVAWIVGEGYVGNGGLCRLEFRGPLLVPTSEEWMGRDAVADHSAAVVTLPAPPSPPAPTTEQQEQP